MKMLLITVAVVLTSLQTFAQDNISAAIEINYEKGKIKSMQFLQDGVACPITQASTFLALMAESLPIVKPIVEKAAINFPEYVKYRNKVAGVGQVEAYDINAQKSEDFHLSLVVGGLGVALKEFLMEQSIGGDSSNPDYMYGMHDAFTITKYNMELEKGNDTLCRQMIAKVEKNKQRLAILIREKESQRSRSVSARSIRSSR